MAEYTRNNAWNNDGSFDNEDLLWYAKGVGAMMGRALNDPTSWWFYAAIHGEYVTSGNIANPNVFPGWGAITGPPKTPITPLPTQAAQDMYWNQCQHGSWYFVPWHRGYLMALEAQLRKDIMSLGGPDTWALPYWNYFGGPDGSQYKMPAAFAQENLPDNTANPLYVAMRYGPLGNGNIFIPCPPNVPNGKVNQNCMSNPIYTGTNAQTTPGFGGMKTGFSNNGSTPGALESNPHNFVHVYVGGRVNQPVYGLMADPGLAALDPIFYLHHANIDRMWEVWNASGHANPTDAAWLNGPAERKFVMPDTTGQPWYYTPGNVQDLSALDYNYQEQEALSAPTESAVATRLFKLGAPMATAALTESSPSLQAIPTSTELMGASAPVRIRERGAQTAVQLDAAVQGKANQSFKKLAVAAKGANMLTASAQPDKAFLRLENVQGTFDATVLDVYVNLPNDSNTSDMVLAGNVALFGLRRASAPDGHHGGDGLNFTLDITDIVDRLHLSGTLNANELQVNIVPEQPLPDQTEIQVGRVSVYRQAF